MTLATVCRIIGEAVAVQLAVLNCQARRAKARTQVSQCLSVHVVACVLVMPVGQVGAVEAANSVDASSYILIPMATQGEREIDWHSGIGSSGSATPHEVDSALAFGMGVTDRWFTEVALRYRRVAGSGTALDAVEWENIVPLAEPNEWPIDLGVALEIELPRDTQEGISVRTGPLLQKEIHNFQINFNILVGRYFQSTQFSATQLEYQGQLKYRYSQPFELGLQAFGSVASPSQTWTAYGQQVHRFGPAVFGRFVLPRERSISYNAAALFGTTAHSPDRTVRFQLEYEF